MTNKASLSVDLEFFRHTPAYRSASGEVVDSAIGRTGVDFLLKALAEANATATFFTVSTIAESHPTLIKRIVEAGHEIASHTHSHRLLTSISADRRVAELRDSRDILESVSGDKVAGFRAPAFDVDDDHFDQLSAVGYEYDSSVAPCRRIPGWYGGEYDTLAPFRPAGEIANDIIEVPVSVFPRIRLPLTGTWMRFFGCRYTVTGMKLLSWQDIEPVLYIHPWELVALPDVGGVPKRVYWNTGEWMQRAVKQILAQPFQFVSVREIATAHNEEIQ
jgi:hypothetical protein